MAIGNACMQAIESDVFSGTLLTDVDIPNSVRTIGTASFSKCSRLVRVALPRKLVSIGKSAFANCDGKYSVILFACLATASCGHCTNSSKHDVSSIAKIYFAFTEN